MSRYVIQTHLLNAELKDRGGKEMSDVKLSENVSSQVLFEKYSQTMRRNK